MTPSQQSAIRTEAARLVQQFEDAGAARVDAAILQPAEVLAICTPSVPPKQSSTQLLTMLLSAWMNTPMA